MANSDFKRLIAESIPVKLPGNKDYDYSQNHVPKRKDILSSEEKKLA